ncbi:MAG: phage repressor protein [Epsilonproteobacteria bacterium]|nr:phage repressor protein [Campylobacterota bacterium]
MKKFLEIVEEIKCIVSSEFSPKKVFDKDVADILGISQMNFATMKKRNKVPFNELMDFCASRKISINWILYGQSPESLIEATNKFYMVRYFENINASAGGGADEDYETIGQLEIPEHFAVMLGGEKELENVEAINVTGDSMEPTFSYDDIVFINRNKKDFAKGGIFTIRTEAGLFIKRIKKLSDTTVEIISDNLVYSSEVLDISEIDVLGKVICKFGVID